MNFSPNELFIWLAVAAAIVAGLNQGIDLFRKLTDSKADKPASRADHLITREVLDEELDLRLGGLSKKFDELKGSITASDNKRSARFEELFRNYSAVRELIAGLNAQVRGLAEDLKTQEGRLFAEVEKRSTLAGRVERT